VLESRTADKAIEHLEDLSHPVKLLQDELERRRSGTFVPRGSHSGEAIPRGPLEDPERFYERKRLYPGRLGAWTSSFNRKHLDPIVRLLKSNGISRQQRNFLYAAARRNEASVAR
jgi:hypothetical protein